MNKYDEEFEMLYGEQDRDEVEIIWPNLDETIEQESDLSLHTPQLMEWEFTPEPKAQPTNTQRITLTEFHGMSAQSLWLKSRLSGSGSPYHGFHQKPVLLKTDDTPKKAFGILLLAQSIFTPVVEPHAEKDYNDALNMAGRRALVDAQAEMDRKRERNLINADDAQETLSDEPSRQRSKI